MNAIISHDGNNPYLNKSYASLKGHPSQVIHEGKLYTKLSYELKINTVEKLIKIIQLVALTIFSCFIALAFQSIRKLWYEAMKGVKSVDVLMPQVSIECTDIWMLIGSNLSIKELFTMRTTSTHKKIIAEKILINNLNAGKITPGDLRISTIRGLIDFFGENCSQITKLNLQHFPQITESDFEKIATHFVKLNHLIINDIKIANESVVHLEKMILLRSLDFSGCREIDDFSFLQDCKGLTSLNLSKCSQIVDFSFLNKCKALTYLNLFRCNSIKDISFLQQCKELINLNLSGCIRINDFSFLQHCKELTGLSLSGCPLIKDLSFLQYCKGLTSLDLSYCHQLKNISFIQYCKELTRLDLSESRQITDFSALLHCKAFTSLKLGGCDQIDDISFLQHCEDLVSLGLSQCYQINDMRFIQHCKELKELDLSYCRQINDFSFLMSCNKLESLNLYGCSQIDDINFLEHCRDLKSLNVYLCNQINDASVELLCNRGVTVNH